MAGAAVGEVMEVTFVTEALNNTFMTVLHYVVSTQSTLANRIADQENMITAIVVGGPDDICTAYMACQSPGSHLVKVRAQYVAPTRVSYSFSDRADPGTYTGSLDTPNVSAVITKRTALTGRSQIGSIHIPCIPAPACSGGELSGTMLGKMTTLIGVLSGDVAEIAGAGLWSPVIWHRKQTPQPKSNLVLTWAKQLEVRTMHRRTLGLGI